MCAHAVKPRVLSFGFCGIFSSSILVYQLPFHLAHCLSIATGNMVRKVAVSGSCAVVYRYAM